MNRHLAILSSGMILFLSAGCGAAVTSYVKPAAPWGLIRRVAVLPFQIPSENSVQRQLVTQLFSEELRRSGRAEVVEVPLESPVGSGVWNVRQVGKEYRADAVFSGSVDETYGTVVHVRLQDVATEDLLWSGTYLLGTRAEFFSFRTQQQRIRQGFQQLVGDFVRQSGLSQAS